MLAMQLHVRDAYTDVIACDGSKIEDWRQPKDTTYKTGPTACGVYQYGGAPPTHTNDAWEARLRAHITPSEEIREAIRKGSHGCRIGDEADTMAAELTAILIYHITCGSSS